MSSSDNVPVVAPFRGHTCRELYKAIFEADAPEQVVRQLPAQSLFMVIKHQGLAASADLLSMASLEQCRLLSDFDLWKEDTLNEEALWEWLALTDETDSLELLQKVVKFVDLKLLAILIGKYVEVKVFDDAADQPPGEGFHTPDKGFTWIGIKTEDPEHHFLLARLLALIFESSAELFYQLLATSSVATVSMLEEESYQERTKRLAAEGVPEAEATALMHAPFSLAEARADIAAGSDRIIIEDIRSIEPLVYEARSTRLFAELMRRVTDHEEVELEFSYIMNAAVVRWAVDFSDQEKVLLLAEKVKGAINIALERVVSDGVSTVGEAYRSLGLTKLYRLGLTELMALRRKAQRVPKDVAQKIAEDDKILFCTLACALEPFPEMPLFLSDDGKVASDDGTLASGQRPIEGVLALTTVHRLLDKIADGAPVNPVA
jgi:hypothetical protein